MVSDKEMKARSILEQTRELLLRAIVLDDQDHEQRKFLKVRFEQLFKVLDSL